MNQQHETYIYDYVLGKTTLSELLTNLSINQQDIKSYIENLILGSIPEKDSDAIENAILLANKTATPINQVLLSCLFSFPWHNQHEEIIDFIDPTDACNLSVFFQAINTNFEYLDQLDQETLHIKALYSLNKNPHPHKLELLKNVANSLGERANAAAKAILEKYH